jgi:hypothetical protein
VEASLSPTASTQHGHGWPEGTKTDALRQLNSSLPERIVMHPHGIDHEGITRSFVACPGTVELLTTDEPRDARSRAIGEISDSESSLDRERSRSSTPLSRRMCRTW